MNAMKRTVIILTAAVVLPYIAAPIIHDCKLHRFDKSIGKIPAPEGYEKVAQQKWFGVLWACGNHADYLVIAVFRGADDDALVHEHFCRDFSVYCPEEKSDAVPLVCKRHGELWQYVVRGETLDDMTDDLHRYLDSFAPESQETLYCIAYAAQGTANSDLRTH